MTEDRRFEEDADLSKAFGVLNRQLLAHYPARAGHPLRIGILFCAAEPRAWGADVLLLEEAVVRELYPVTGPAEHELTAFQKKNREQSIYRGGELLLDFRSDLRSTVPVYCPVLYARGLTLDQLAPAFGLVPRADEARRPALALLNLLTKVL